jgi:parallel beta helix pectate lyase-like protein
MGCNTGSRSPSASATTAASTASGGTAPSASGSSGTTAGATTPPAPGGAARAGWPIGIPVPAFGTTDSHTQFAGQVGSGRYRDAGHGPYTHYVDNTASNASDANPGTAAEPLATIPLSLSPGDVVEIHGGPYAIPAASLTGVGTAAEPIFVRGVDDGQGLPQWTDGRLEISGSYLVIETIDFNRGALRLAPASDHVVVRDNEIHENPDRSGFVGSGSDILLYRNHIHHFQADNRHGITNGHGTLRFWIIGNEVHHNAEDSFQCGHTNGAGPPPTYSEYIYIGGNTFYSDRENAVDLKWVKNVVISQNVCTSYESAPVGSYTFDDGSHTGTYSSGSDGSAILIGSDGVAEDVWILFNEIHDNDAGIRIEEVAGARIVGNTIRNIVRDGVRFEKEGGEIHVVGNTIHSVQGSGLNQDWREDFTLFVHNNLISEAGNRSVNVESGTVSGRSSMSHNLFWQGGGPASVSWGSGQAQTYATSGDLSSFIGGSDNLVEDPQLKDAATGDLGVLAGSPALTGGLHPDSLPVYALFDAQHPGAGGIRFNADGDPVPTAGTWQIGASGAR